MNKQTFQLTGKKVIVLGASSGIGLETAKAAAAAGATVTIVSGNKDRIEKALQQLPAGSKAMTVDLSNELAIKAFFTQTGGFDHLVYTAGENLSLTGLDETDFDAARRFWNIRYWGAFAAVKYAKPHIAPDGAVVLTGGIAGQRPSKGWAAASSICGAMEGLTRALAMDLAPIRVNCVVPGVVRTNLWNAFSPEDRQRLYEQTSLALPVRKVGEPEDIALTYLYLLCQPYSTGQCITVDGGGVLV